MFSQCSEDMDLCNEIIDEYVNNIRKTPRGTMSTVMGWVAEYRRFPGVTCVIVAGFLLFGVLVYKIIQLRDQLKRVTQERDRIAEYCGIVEADRNITEDDRNTSNEQLSTVQQNNTTRSRTIFVTMENGTRIAMENGTRITTTDGTVISMENDEVTMSKAVAKSFAGVRVMNAG